MGTHTNRNFGGAHSGNGVGHHRSAPGVPPGASLSPKGWQRERVQRLARIFRCIDAGRARGKRLHKMLTRFAWIWRTRNYKCDPAREIHFQGARFCGFTIHGGILAGHRTRLPFTTGAGIARRQLARWLSCRSCAWRPRPRVSVPAYRTLKSPNATHWAYRKAMPPRLKAALAALLAHRRRGLALERAARRLLEGLAK